MHICGYDVNSRIERYAALLRGLEKAHSLQLPVAEIELSVGEKARMVNAIDSDIYNLTARRRNYLVLRLDSFLSDGAASYDVSLLTIEHVLPQSVKKGSQWAEWWPDLLDQITWVHKLANLVPLNQRRNSSAQNYDFEIKKKKYFSGRDGISSFALTTQVLAVTDWKPETLELRQKTLISLLVEKWELS
jgi:hypothetical protein